MSAIIVRNSNSYHIFQLENILLKIILEQNFQNTDTIFFHHPNFQRSRNTSFTRITKFPLPTNIEGRHSRSEKWWSSLNDSKSRKRFISTRRRIEPIHHTCHTVSPRGNDGSLCTCERNTRASSVAKRFWHESNLVSSRANFSKSKRTYYY